MKLSITQTKVIDSLKEGAIISYFRGIGTRYPASASLEKDGSRTCSISVATVRKLRHNGLLEEYDREAYHSKYKLKEKQ